MGGWIQEKLYEVLTSSETGACPTLSKDNLPWRVHNSNSMPTNSSDLMKKLVHSPTLPPPHYCFPNFLFPPLLLLTAQQLFFVIVGIFMSDCLELYCLPHLENVAFKNGGWILNCWTPSGKNLPSSCSVEFGLLNFVVKKCTQLNSPNIIQYNIFSHLG